MISDAEIERAIDWLRDNAEPAAKARAERLYLEHWIKTVKAQEMAKLEGKSNAAAETLALTAKPYIDALIAYKAAIYEDERIRFLTGAAEAKIEAWRSFEATRRVVKCAKSVLLGSRTLGQINKSPLFCFLPQLRHLPPGFLRCFHLPTDTGKS